ncbi:hypothetical protein WA026_019137 [Henosepilachna vigintioctopunctata]|uniref:Uncharacterized protein n=1 Tax=Henosepilachna vigintioctopunctata TaxID=420089 RepID=A0AAW1UUQ9_9CUCU
MSTSEYEQPENQTTFELESEELESCPIIQPLSLCCEYCGENQQDDFVRPTSASSGIPTPKSQASRPATGRKSRPETPRPKTPAVQKEADEPFSESSEIPQQYGTECDLAATQAPAELLPQIDSKGCPKSNDVTATPSEIKKDISKPKDLGMLKAELCLEYLKRVI